MMRFGVDNIGGVDRVVLADGDVSLLTSPPEGLWSVALAWEDGWPTKWAHAHPSRVETNGDWTLLYGELDEGWHFRDAYIREGDIIKCIRRFKWHQPTVCEGCTLSVRFLSPGFGTGILMPGVMYYGNPSGERSNAVPLYDRHTVRELFVEEHRLPMPFASFEWAEDDDRYGAALHTVPSPVVNANLHDQWWSVGVEAVASGTEMALLSGPCAMNGFKSSVKAFQGRGGELLAPYDYAYLIVQPGAIIEKTFYLDAYSVVKEGEGFQTSVRKSVQVFQPWSLDGMPDFTEIIQNKYRYALTRWYDNGPVAGFRKYSDRNMIVLGWCGQAASLGYALQVLDVGSDCEEKVQKSLDLLSTSEFYDEGFRTWYDADECAWMDRDRPEMLSQGQGMHQFARAIKHGRNNDQLETSKWEDFLTTACDFHARRILEDDWHSVSTNEAFFIAPLCLGTELFDAALYRDAAVKAGDVYAERHLQMREPYWGGTLDAQCEDKEGAIAALQGFLALYDLTGDQKYLDWAQHACDVTLSYVYVWDVDMPPGRLRDHNFKTRGWTAVSVQNQHIDVYGVYCAPDVYHLGELTGSQELMDLALLMYRSCGQLIDPLGSQGEQPQQTNYAQHPDNIAKGMDRFRGDYCETWTVFWITAHFLNAAARFKEMGVIT